jgi:phosphorylated CTD-interacting factor 1
MSDDLIASLMQEMGEKQGYCQDETNDDQPGEGQNVQKTSEAGVFNKMSRQLSELQQYPHNSYLAGSHSIWNPLVAGGAKISVDETCDPPSGRCNQQIPLLPTNLQVEVIRRRVFEKFRLQAQTLIQQALLGGGSMAQQQQNQQWARKLPIPAMLEKWHMDAKLQEQRQCLEQVTKQMAKDSVEFSHSVAGANVGEILRRRRELRQSRLPIYDPILLSKQAPSLFRDTLYAEVQKVWKQSQQFKEVVNNNVQNTSPLPPKFNKRAQRIQKGLYKLVCEAIDSFESQLSVHASQESMQNHRKGNSQKRAKIKHPADHYGMVQVNFAGVTLKLHANYFEKLQRLFDRNIARQQEQNISNDEYLPFEDAVFCLLCRYDMIQGAGLQAGLPGSVMDVLLQRFDCRMECFASPLNCRYDRFGSAFPDVDGPFGSRGSFFDWAERLGEYESEDGLCLQANPPFCDGLIAELNKTISEVLSSDLQSNRQCPIMFVVFVPAWRDANCYQLLLDNPFLTKHILLEQCQHWYAEGTRHRRKDSFRLASFDTSILFYQNEAAKEKWDLASDTGNGFLAMEELQDAFCRDPSHEQQISQEMMKMKADKKSRLEKTDASRQVVDPQPPSNSPTKLTKREKKKRKWTEHGEEKAQLDLLQSLDLDKQDEENGESTKTNSRSSNNNNTVEFDKKSKKRKRHRGK